jgi:PIN domain nuclease of toxin-antitoxin system
MAGSEGVWEVLILAERSCEVLASYPDPVDRFLVATVLIYELTLVTRDETLIGSKLCPVLQNG